MAPLNTAKDWADFALPLRRPTRIQPSFNFNSDEVVTLLVGKSEHRMSVHPVYVTQSSEFFKVALKKEWDEGQTRIVKLPEETPQLFAYYLDFVYSKKIPTDVYVTEVSYGDRDNVTILLAELYVLGERMLDKNFQNELLRELVRFMKLPVQHLVDFVPPFTAMSVTYQGTTAGSPARRLLVDIFLRHPFEDYVICHLEKEFLADLAKASIKKTGKEERRSLRMVDLQASNYLH